MLKKILLNWRYYAMVIAMGVGMTLVFAAGGDLTIETGILGELSIRALFFLAGMVVLRSTTVKCENSFDWTDADGKIPEFTNQKIS